MGKEGENEASRPAAGPPQYGRTQLPCFGRRYRIYVEDRLPVWIAGEKRRIVGDITYHLQPIGPRDDLEDSMSWRATG